MYVVVATPPDPSYYVALQNGSWGTYQPGVAVEPLTDEEMFRDYFENHVTPVGVVNSMSPVADGFAEIERYNMRVGYIFAEVGSRSALMDLDPKLDVPCIWGAELFAADYLYPNQIIFTGEEVCVRTPDGLVFLERGIHCIQVEGFDLSATQPPSPTYEAEEYRELLDKADAVVGRFAAAMEVDPNVIWSVSPFSSLQKLANFIQTVEKLSSKEQDRQTYLRLQTIMQHTFPGGRKAALAELEDAFGGQTAS